MALISRIRCAIMIHHTEFGFMLPQFHHTFCPGVVLMYSDISSRYRFLSSISLPPRSTFLAHRRLSLPPYLGKGLSSSSKSNANAHIFNISIKFSYRPFTLYLPPPPPSFLSLFFSPLSLPSFFFFSPSFIIYFFFFFYHTS